MKLVLDELKSAGLMQRVTTPASVQDVYAVRVHLGKYLAPAGSLYLELRTAAGVLVATSETRTIAAINSSYFASANYGHDNIRFLISAHLSASTTYQLWLKSTGYTFATTAFIGWARDFDLRIYDPSSSYGNASGTASPYLYDFFTYQDRIKGA